MNTLTHSIVWYGHTAPGLVEVRVRTYLNSRAIEERSLVGLPDDHPMPATVVDDDAKVAGLTNAALQSAAEASGRSTWDETHICAVVSEHLGGDPVTFEAPPELVAREAAAKADDAPSVSAAAPEA